MRAELSAPARLPRSPSARCGSATHRRECRREIGGRPVGQTGMNANRRVELGVSCRHHRRHCAAGREPRDEHTLWIDIVAGDDLTRDPGQDRRLAGAALLVLGREPVPAQGRISGLRLARIGDDKAMLLGKTVHARSRREVVSVLRAAMQHHQQRATALREPARNVELVVSAPRRAGKGPAQELSAIRNVDTLSRPGIFQRIEAEGRNGVALALDHLPHAPRPGSSARRQRQS